jgi:hypothetical protein
MDSALFVAHQEVFEVTPFFESVKFIVNGQNRTPWIAKDVSDSVPFQTVEECKGTADLLLLRYW